LTKKEPSGVNAKSERSKTQKGRDPPFYQKPPQGGENQGPTRPKRIRDDMGNRKENLRSTTSKKRFGK